jgi:hypothetical protein
MVRWVFRPYTYVWRTSCASVSLRSSTRVSPGFDLRQHSSPSFGSEQAYSNLLLGTKRSRSWRQNTFISEERLHPEFLAYLLNSLVRVSRRDADTKCRVRIPKVSHKILSRPLTLKENWTPSFLEGAPGQLFLCMRFPFNIFSAFNSPSGVLFIFPSRYLFAIGLPFHN